MRVNACPSVRSLCGRKTICPDKMAIERPEARKVPTGHLASPESTTRTRFQSWPSSGLRVVITVQRLGCSDAGLLGLVLSAELSLPEDELGGILG